VRRSRVESVPRHYATPPTRGRLLGDGPFLQPSLVKSLHLTELLSQQTRLSPLLLFPYQHRTAPHTPHVAHHVRLGSPFLQLSPTALLLQRGEWPVRLGTTGGTVPRATPRASWCGAVLVGFRELRGRGEGREGRSGSGEPYSCETPGKQAAEFVERGEWVVGCLDAICAGVLGQFRYTLSRAVKAEQ
jgi:hypothetical protein